MDPELALASTSLVCITRVGLWHPAQDKDSLTAGNYVSTLALYLFFTKEETIRHILQCLTSLWWVKGLK